MTLAVLDFTMVDDVDFMAQRIRKAAVFKHLMSLEVPALANGQFGPGQITGAQAAAQAVVDGIQVAGDAYYTQLAVLYKAVSDLTLVLTEDAFTAPTTTTTSDAMVAAKAALFAHVDAHASVRRDVVIVD